MVGEIKVNYNLECEKILNSLDLNNKKTLLLHSCCAPCSSAVLERISKYFKITILFYNPNITDYSEYLKRKDELKRLIKEVGYDIEVMDCDYDKEKFISMALGMVIFWYMTRCIAVVKYQEKNNCTFKQAWGATGTYEIDD